MRKDGLESLFQVGGVGIEGLCHRGVVEVGIGTEVTGTFQTGLQLVDGNAELGVIHHAGLLIEIQVETTDIVIALWKSATKQLAAAHHLHASAAGSHEGQQRLRHHGGTLTDGYGLVVIRQVVHLQQH